MDLLNVAVVEVTQFLQLHGLLILSVPHGPAHSVRAVGVSEHGSDVKVSRRDRKVSLH